MFKPSALYAFLSASLIFSRYPRSVSSLNQHSFAYVFLSYHPSLLHFSHCVYNSQGFLTLLHPSSGLHGPVPRLPSLGSGPPQDATVSLGRQVLRLLLLVTRWRHLISRVFHPISIIVSLRRFPGYVSPPPSSPFSSPFPFPPPSLSSCSFPSSSSFPSPPHPCSRHRPVPGTRFSPRYHIVGQAAGLALKAAGHLQAPPPVYRDDNVCGMAVPNLPVCFFPDVADSRAPPPPSPYPFSFLLLPRSRPHHRCPSPSRPR